jgi:polyhydroxyalkanoate synthase
MAEPTFDFAHAAEAFLDSMATTQKRLLHGFQSLTSTLDTRVGATANEEVHKIDRIRLIHYIPETPNPRLETPLLVVYALVNRPYMMDLQADRSVIKKLLEYGLDVYLIDWGYPRKMDRYLTLQDYIEDYIGGMVDFLRARHGVDTINILGVCQGGTFSTIYTSLHQEKVKNLVTMVAPFDFDTRDGLLNVWARALDPQMMVDVMGNIDGDFMNAGFLMLNPARLMVDKYMSFFEHMDDPAFVENFVRMERWIFDSPDQAGEAWKQFMKDTYIDNKLVRGEMMIGDRRVSLKNVTCPILNVFAGRDHLVPPAASRPLADLVSSEDVETVEFPTGHIGMFTSRKSQTEYAPKIGQWLVDHSAEKKPAKKRAK